MGNKFKHRYMKDKDTEVVRKFLRAKRLREKERLQKMRAKIDLAYSDFTAYLQDRFEPDEENRGEGDLKVATHD